MFVTQDVVREIQNPLEGEITLVEPRPVTYDLDPEHLVPATIL